LVEHALDDLVRSQQERLRDRQAECFGGLEIDRASAMTTRRRRQRPQAAGITLSKPSDVGID
jgi:hypothetical protein